MAALTGRERIDLIGHCASALATLAAIQEKVWSGAIDDAMLTVRNLLEELLEQV